MVARQLHAATNSDSRSARTKKLSQRLKALNAEKIRLDERFKSSIADKDNFSRTSREALHHRRSIAYAEYEDFLIYQSPRFRGKRFRRLIKSYAQRMESMATNEPDILASPTIPTTWLRAILDGFDTKSVGQRPSDNAANVDLTNQKRLEIEQNAGDNRAPGGSGYEIGRAHV